MIDTPDTDCFLTIEGRAEAVYKEKNSRFTGLAFPIESEDDARNTLAEVRKKYPDANHHCYAYVLGPDQKVARSSDDGEPSGTAGKNILLQITKLGLTNVLVIVVRYFGGIKLGTGRLTKAYRETSTQALASASKRSVTCYDSFQITFDYSSTTDIMRILKEGCLDPEKIINDYQCTLIFSVRKNDSETVQKKLSSVKKLIINRLNS